jgi:sugar/nucleoside kinase (ribokinase family)
MNVEIVGHVCIDRNTTEHGFFTGAGSPAMFMEPMFRLLSGRVTIVSSYGADFLPYRRGVSMYPPEPNIGETMVYENDTTGEKRTQKCFHYEEAQPVDLDLQLIEIIKGADVICFAPLAPNYSAAYIRKTLQYKKEGAKVVLLPQGYFRQFDEENNVYVREFEEAEDILPLMDVVIVSDQDHEGMAGIAAEWNRRFGCIVVMTEAEKGARVFDHGAQTEVPTVPVPVRDIVSSVGAGDRFSAGFSYSFSQAGDPLQAARIGNSLARQGLFCTPDNITIVLPE